MVEPQVTGVTGSAVAALAAAADVAETEAAVPPGVHEAALPKAAPTTVSSGSAPVAAAAPLPAADAVPSSKAPAAVAPVLAADLLPTSKRVTLAELPEQEVKREGGPLGGVPHEWDAFNAEELKALRQVKAWMSDRPGLFERCTSDMLVTFLRGYAPLVNWVDHVYARLEAMLRWRAEERIDTALLDEQCVAAEKASLFARAMPCGAIGHDAHGHVVALETPGASSSLMNQMFAEMECGDFVKLMIYNKEVQRHYVASVSLAEKRRLYKVVNVVDLSGFGSAQLKSIFKEWFKAFVAVFSLSYPETMYRTYVINAPVVFTGVWKIARNFIHPVTAAKVSVSSWGHNAIFKRDGIALFNGTIKESLKPWRSVAASLADTHDLAALAAGCYAPPEDVAAVAALKVVAEPDAT